MRIDVSGARALLGALVFLVSGACASARTSPDPATRATQPIDSALAVATFDSAWQRIADTHFDTAFGGVDWRAVRSDLRPRAASARDNQELRTVLRTMISRLGESHFGLIPQEASPPADADAAPVGDGKPRFEIRMIEEQIVVTEVDTLGEAYAAAVRPGWVLLRVDTIDVEAILRRLRDADTELPARMERMHAWAMVNRILSGPVGSHVEFVMRDVADRPVRLTLRREAPRGEVVRLMQLPPMAAYLEHERRATPGGATVGIIRFNIWLAPIARQLAQAMDALRDADGIVLDLRGNLGGLGAMSMGVAGHFIDTTLSLGTMRTRDTQLRFVVTPQRVTTTGTPVRPYAGPLVLIVDELSVSTSEIFASGIQAVGRAQVVGDTTTGQALPARTIRLPNGDVLMHAFADFHDAGGGRIEGRGVIPDVQVSRERADLVRGRDRMLETAIRLIDERRAAPAPRGTGANGSR